MHKLWHFRLCPRSRFVRLALGELGIDFALIEERPWEWRAGFLALNPAGELPVLELDGGPVLCGAYAITEFVAEQLQCHMATGRPAALLPANHEDRAEVRRLIDWFNGKFEREVTRDMLEEKIVARNARPHAGREPDPEIMRAIRANLRYHLGYIGFLAHQRRWLAGEEMSLADLAAAAHLSCLDYLNEVPWDEHPTARDWYARVKSRPALRPILADRVPGTPPPLHYTNLDF